MARRGGDGVHPARRGVVIWCVQLQEAWGSSSAKAKAARLVNKGREIYSPDNAKGKTS
jgi:hypothetical protein